MSQVNTPGSDIEARQTNPLVSVIIPVYNATQYIAEALDSIFAQTFTDYEVIVINDGCPDTPNLERALRPYRERIVYIKQENQGVSSARNAGLRVARGRYVAQCDSDDAWEPEYLAVQTAMLERDPSIDLLYPNGLIFGDGLGAGRKCMDLSPSEGEVTFKSLITQQCTVTMFATARLETVVRAGMFDESLRSSEDFDLWLRIAKQGGRIVYHQRVLARYRRRGGSLSSDPVWMCEHILKVMDKSARTLELTPDEREALEQQRARFRATLRFCEGKKALFQGDVKEAIGALTEANAFFRSPKTSLIIFLLRFAPRLMLHAYDVRDRFIFRTDTKF